MYWFFADETNVRPEQGKFFIYGGIVVTPEQIIAIHDAIVAIRAKYGFLASDRFKFQTPSRPVQLSIEDWTSAKSEALSSAHSIGAKMMVYVVHHGIAGGGGETTIEYALNTLVAHFDMRFLSEKRDYGALCVDRIDEKFGYRYLRERFQSPLDLQDGRKPTLERVIHYSMSCDGASHISSLVDLAVGGFRYCANAAMGTGRGEIAKDLIRPIAGMMWGVEKDGKKYIGEYGLVKRPINVRVSEYRADYDKLSSMLTEYSGGTEEGHNGVK